jgi:hypothetical protein
LFNDLFFFVLVLQGGLKVSYLVSELLGDLFESQGLALRVSVLSLPETQEGLGDLLGGAADPILEARIDRGGHLLTEILGVEGALMVAIVFSLGILHEVGHLHLDGVVEVLLDL